ncbi:MAG: hypothetical protein H6705_12370 [Myxococcales bacterium]|nr:hypothetical protein [Myxococcales bacterium]
MGGFGRRADLVAAPVPAAGIGRALMLRALGGLGAAVPVLLVPEPDGAAAVVVDGPDVVALGGGGGAVGCDRAVGGRGRWMGRWCRWWRGRGGG